MSYEPPVTDLGVRTDLEALCETKATEQLRVNPLGKDGFVCVARFRNPAARLWYYKRNHRNA